MESTYNKGERKTILILGFILCFISAIIWLILGFYKMTNVNAYVGGDAYNYIINGTYTTAYFVLSIGSFISGTVLFATYCILPFIDKKSKEETASEVQSAIIE